MAAKKEKKLEPVSSDSKNVLHEMKMSHDKVSLNKDDLLRYYQEMLKIRRFEERAGQLYGMGQIGGFCHCI